MNKAEQLRATRQAYKEKADVRNHIRQGVHEQRVGLRRDTEATRTAMVAWMQNIERDLEQHRQAAQILAQRVNELEERVQVLETRPTLWQKFKTYWTV